jgi:hypothetical protein
MNNRATSYRVSARKQTGSLVIAVEVIYLLTGFLTVLLIFIILIGLPKIALRKSETKTLRKICGLGSNLNFLVGVYDF